MEKKLKYSCCIKEQLSIAEIEEALLDYFEVEELDDGGCYINGKWFSLKTVMEAITDCI